MPAALYSRNQVRLLRWLVIALALGTVAVAGLTFLQNHSASEVPLILGGMIAGWALYSVADRILPHDLTPLPVLPMARPRPAPLPVWDEAADEASPLEAEGGEGLTPLSDTRS